MKYSQIFSILGLHFDYNHFLNLCKTINRYFWSWILYFRNIILSYSIRMINHKNKIKISARFWPIFDFELNEKRSRAEPSWKSFSSSYGSSQLGSGSSLVTTQNQIDLQRKTYFCFISKKKNRESKVRSQKFTVIFSFIINIFQFLKYTWTLFAIFFRNWKNKNRKNASIPRKAVVKTRIN